MRSPKLLFQNCCSTQTQPPTHTHTHTEFEEDGSPDLSTLKPIIDGGTEGFKGHARWAGRERWKRGACGVFLQGNHICWARSRSPKPPCVARYAAPRRVILPGLTPCFECTLWLFPPQTKFPLCTLAETPRRACVATRARQGGAAVHAADGRPAGMHIRCPATQRCPLPPPTPCAQHRPKLWCAPAPKTHCAPRAAAPCIEYAHLIQWSQQRQGDEFDTDSEEHMKWVYERALERARQYGIAVGGAGAREGGVRLH